MIIILVYLIMAILTTKYTFWYWQKSYPSIARERRIIDFLFSVFFGLFPLGWPIAWFNIIRLYIELRNE